jgi:UPF0042 nucleotide-binding protein
MTDPAGPPTRLVLITGLSGSGKTSVAHAFEDLGYHTVDNLPLPLLRVLLQDPGAVLPERSSLAVVTDVRAPGFHREFPRLWEEIDRSRLRVALLFLEASDETLLRRFSETRRPHPLAPDRPLLSGIREERELLADIRDLAHRVLDTGAWNIHDVRQQINREFAAHPEAAGGLVLSLTSFGFKHGVPYGTDMLFDVRHLPNPQWHPELRDRTGRDREVQEFLHREPSFVELVDRLADFLLFLLPQFRGQDRSYLSVAIGCTGGRHRSVAVAVAVGERLAAQGWSPTLEHRDLERGG